jgi:hypothetical protein
VEVLGLFAQRPQEIRENEPARSRPPWRSLGLQEALDAPPQVGEGPFFLGDIGDRQDDVGLRQVRGHGGADDDNDGRARERASPVRQVHVGDDQASPCCRRSSGAS